MTFNRCMIIAIGALIASHLVGCAPKHDDTYKGVRYVLVPR